MISQNFTLQGILEGERDNERHDYFEISFLEVDLVDLLFGNRMNVVTIRFGELCSNISVGGCWDLILDPMIFERLLLGTHLKFLWET